MGLLQDRLKESTRPQEFMAQGIYPYFRQIYGKQGPVVDMDGHKVLMFGSNAYTGLTYDERIIDAACKALHKYGSGCAGSRFLNGTLDLHVQLEKELAEFVGKDESLCFSTGFSVNAGVIACEPDLHARCPPLPLIIISGTVPRPALGRSGVLILNKRRRSKQPAP
jgi:8-amino-7-oxononanoate synthase